MKKREKKIRDTKRSQEQRRLEKKHRLDDVLSALGILKKFQDLPARLRDQVLQTLPAWPEVCIDQASRGRLEIEDLKREIEELLEVADISTDDGQSVSLVDCYCACPALAVVLSCLDRRMLSGKHRLVVEEATKSAAAFLEESVYPELIGLSWWIKLVLMAHSHIDDGLFGCFMELGRLRPGKPMFRLTLTYSEPRKLPVEIDGQVRRVFQCGFPSWFEGFEWMECDGEAFGLEKGRKYPFFIQPHALLRLRERLAPDSLTEVDLNRELSESLSDLRVVEHQGNSYWIEYRLIGHRVGYLIARVAEHGIVIMTFLFLTMQGTPESRLLADKLRLSRRDIEHEELDRLETFLSSDVRADPLLVSALKECGCGSLLELDQDCFMKGPTRNSAEELKRYLRITDEGYRKKFKSYYFVHCTGALLAPEVSCSLRRGSPSTWAAPLVAAHVATAAVQLKEGRLSNRRHRK